MLHFEAFKRLPRLPRRIVRESHRMVQLMWLSFNNRFGRSPVTQPDGPVVSLTTYGSRSQTVHLTLESIACGTLRPARLILWIDEEALFRNLPNTIRRLQKRGLEVKLCKNYGPHKKYYPYLESEEVFDTPLVTADDDVLYPRYWLEKLFKANREHSGDINCFWAHVIGVSESGLSEYRSWKQCDSTHPSFLHLATGMGGVIYPPLFLTKLKLAGTEFEKCCPKGDDLWLHVLALRNGFKVRQILSRLPYFSFHPIPGTEETALSYENATYGDGNDRQTAATYSDADVRLLLADLASLSK